MFSIPCTDTNQSNL